MRLAIIAQVSNVIGTVLIFFALSFTPTGFRVVHAKKDDTLLCFGDKAFLEAGPGNESGVGMSAPCPAGASEIAVLSAYHPRTAELGLLLIVVGSSASFVATLKSGKRKA